MSVVQHILCNHDNNTQQMCQPKIITTSGRKTQLSFAVEWEQQQERETEEKK